MKIVEREHRCAEHCDDRSEYSYQCKVCKYAVYYQGIPLEEFLKDKELTKERCYYCVLKAKQRGEE